MLVNPEEEAYTEDHADGEDDSVGEHLDEDVNPHDCALFPQSRQSQLQRVILSWFRDSQAARPRPSRPPGFCSRRRHGDHGP